MHKMVPVYVQAVLEGLLVILVGLANEQQTKHKNHDIYIAAVVSYGLESLISLGLSIFS